MALLSFRLVFISPNGEIETGRFTTLKLCLKHFKLVINDARNYQIEEYCGTELNDFCSAFYLLEKYKDLNKLPITIQDC